MHVNTHFLLWGVWANLCCLTPTIVICLGSEGWNLYGCLNFRLSYCICNWCWISNVALNMEFNLIIKYFNYINQAYYSQVYSVLLMEGRQKVWNPHFMAMLFHIARIDCSSIWVIDMMAMGKLKLQCVQRPIHGWRPYLRNVVDLSLHD